MQILKGNKKRKRSLNETTNNEPSKKRKITNDKIQNNKTSMHNGLYLHIKLKPKTGEKLDISITSKIFNKYRSYYMKLHSVLKPYSSQNNKDLNKEIQILANIIEILKENQRIYKEKTPNCKFKEEDFWISLDPTIAMPPEKDIKNLKMANVLNIFSGNKTDIKYELSPEPQMVTIKKVNNNNFRLSNNEKSNKKNHVSNKKEYNEYCFICKQFIDTKDNLLQHMILHTKEICKYCNKLYIVETSKIETICYKNHKFIKDFIMKQNIEHSNKKISKEHVISSKKISNKNQPQAVSSFIRGSNIEAS